MSSYRISQGRGASRVLEYVHDSGADFFSAWVDGRGWRRVEFWVFPAGAITSQSVVLSLQASPLGDAGNDDPIVTVPSTSGGFGLWPNLNATAGAAVIVVESPLAFMRIKYDHSAGIVVTNGITIRAILSRV